MVGPVLSLRYPVVLASASPRRRELLERLVAEFEVIAAAIDEDALTTADPWQTAIGLARAKANAVARLRSEALVIGSDTVVAIRPDGPADWRLLGKPRDEKDAAAMLRELSGRTHVVITGVALVWPEGSDGFLDSTEVTFRELSEVEIQAYAASGEPLDKAGGYAIQGGAAGFVERREGSWENVVGLPTERLMTILSGLSISRN